MAKNKINIGTFRLGVLNVRVIADVTAEGGSYTSTTTPPTITVGFDQNSWGEVAGVLLHEALEFQHMLGGHKHRAVPMSSYDSADVTFMFNHSQFGRVCMDVGHFVVEALPALAKVYQKHKKLS